MLTVFSSTGCIRCKIVKGYLMEHGIPYAEHDVTTEEGKAAFREFYHARRASVKRDAQGIFFPVVQDGEAIVQDAGPCLARFIAGEKLSEQIAPSNLGHGWTGISLPLLPDSLEKAFCEVVSLMKKGGLQIEASTAGANPRLLEHLLSNRLIDRLKFEIKPEVDEMFLSMSLEAAAKHISEIDFRLYLDIADLFDAGGQPPSASACGALAERIRKSAGTGNMSFTLSCSSPQPLNLFPYRTAARRWLPKADIASK